MMFELILAGVVAAVLVGAYVAGRRKGAKQERLEQEQARANAMREKKEVADGIAAMDDAALDAAIHRWLRD